MTGPDPLAINLNAPAHTDLLADTDLWLKAAAEEVDAALGAGYQYGFFSGITRVYDTVGTFAVTVPGLNVIQGAIGSLATPDGTNDAPYFGIPPQLYTLSSYNAGGAAGTVYGQAWTYPYQASVYVYQGPGLVDKLMHQEQPSVPVRQNTNLRACIIAWGSVL